MAKEIQKWTHNMVKRKRKSEHMVKMDTTMGNEERHKRERLIRD